MVPQKTILLAVTGMSPAVLTETVWALAQEKPAVIPDEIRVVTTAKGRDVLQRELFGPDQLWDQLRKSLGAAAKGKLVLDPSPDAGDVRLFTRRDEGRRTPISELQSSGDQDAIADCLLAEVWQCARDDRRLVASIAGGYKSMGALLLSVMQLLGRPGDRVVHVLVSSPFEDPKLLPRFAFPKQKPNQLKTPDGSIHKASSAKIQLLEVPFIALRHWFAEKLHRLPGSYTALVAECSQSLDRQRREGIHLEISLSRREARVNGAPLPRLSMREHLVLLFHASCAKFPEYHRFSEPKQRYEALCNFAKEQYSSAPEDNPADARHEMRWDDISGEDIDHRKALSSLRKKLADPRVSPLQRVLPNRTQLRLDLPAESIAIVERLD